MRDPAISDQIANATTVRVLSVLTNKPDETLTNLQAAFLAGSENGETILKLASRVQHIITVSRDEALSIARNTMGFILSKVRFDGAISSGLTHKKWLCTNCPIFGHGLAGVEYKKPIPISEPFIVNGMQLMYPRDFMSEHIDECIDCECMCIASLAVVK